MKKRLISLLTVISLCISMTIPALAIEANKPNIVKGQTVLTVDKFTSNASLSAADVIVVDYDELSSISENAKDLVDNGAIICILSPEESNESIAEKLSIPRDTVSKYNPLTLVATYIYLMDGIYVFGNNWAVGTDTLSTESESMKTSVDESFSELTDQESIAGVSFSQVLPLSTMEVANSVETAALKNAVVCSIEDRQHADAFVDQVQANSEVNADSVQLQSLPSSQANQIYTGSTQVLSANGAVHGNCYATEYVYYQGYATVNGTRQYVYNAVTDFSAYPNSGYLLKTFTGRMHCNITGHTMVDSVILPSDNDQTVTLSVGYPRSVGVSWTFNPNGRTISSTKPGAKIADYKLTNNLFGSSNSSNITPGVCVATTNSAGSRGVFSKMTCPNYDIPSTDYSFEVGGWF